GFFLIFAPAGAAFSVDRLIRIRRGKEPAVIEARRPWAQRMIQIQLSLLYFVTFLMKIKCAPLLQGSAFFYVYHLDELKRFPLPNWCFKPIMIMLGSWSALALDFSLGLLICIRDCWYVMLIKGLLFHHWLGS